MRRVPVVLALAAGLAAALAGCSSAAPPWTTAEGRAAIEARHAGEEWTHVAACSGIDWLTLGHVGNVLLAEGVPSAAGGSRIYGIEVPRSQAARARAVLLERQRRDVYSCWATGGGPGSDSESPASLWISWQRPDSGVLTAFGVTIADALADPALDARIAAALREKHVTDLVATLPVLDSVELWERPYLGDDGEWKRGAYLEVRLVSGTAAPAAPAAPVAPGSPGTAAARPGWFRLHYSVWDAEPRAPTGGCAMFQGGSGAGPALETRDGAAK